METPTTIPSYDVCRSYEQLPYESGPHYPTHPDCLATVATLMGMRPADVGAARVLELGSGNGGNLIPMAAGLPEARFLGVDLSPRQIGQGQELIRAAGLENVELRAADLLDLGEELGTFDYIICHGVYSWVPAAVRDKILSICRDSLAPHGVAYVSYNTYPGWHFRGVAKDMLHFHTRHLDQPDQRLAEARGLLNFLVQSIPDNETPYARVIRSEAEGFQREPDYYLVHEFLDEVNQPFYFYQFAEAAAEKSLQFLAEAWHHTRLDDLPTQVQQTIRDISPDLIHVEQYLDFLRQRTFRRTLLCHDSISLSRSPTMEQILGMSVSAMAWPLEEADQDPDVRRRAVPHGCRPDHHDQPPGRQSGVCPIVGNLSADHRSRRSAGGSPLPNSIARRTLQPLSDADLAGLLVRCFLSNSLMFHVHAPRFAGALSDMPCASAFCRVQAGLGAAVANQWHRQFELNELDRQILVRLDGDHNRQHLVKEIGQLVEDGTLTAEMLQQAAPELPWSAGDNDLGGYVDVSLQRLLSHAFLIT